MTRDILGEALWEGEMCQHYRNFGGAASQQEQ